MLWHGVCYSVGMLVDLAPLPLLRQFLPAVFAGVRQFLPISIVDLSINVIDSIIKE